MNILSRVEVARKRLAETLFLQIITKFQIEADEITRASGWCCFFAGFAILANNFVLATILLSFGLILDAMDGVAARLRGKHEPEVDWAMDRFTEAVLTAALLIATNGHLFSWILAGCFVLNNFLPIKYMRVLALRWVVLFYLIYLANLSAG